MGILDDDASRHLPYTRGLLAFLDPQQPQSNGILNFPTPQPGTPGLAAFQPPANALAQPFGAIAPSGYPNALQGLSWAGQQPGNEARGLAAGLARFMAPNLTGLVAGDQPPPLANLPDMPGKVPSTDDPRGFGSLPEMANVLANFMPVGGPAKGVSTLAGALAGAAKTLGRSERFNWPVATLSGRTIDMPISVNPSARDIIRELANAPHGDVRALRAPTGDVYLWPANEAMHRDIASSFDLPFKTLKDLQGSSYLFNAKDVQALGGFKNFDELITRLGQ